MAAILITMIMMIVITIIVLGYNQISSQVQQSALNRQLNTQAYYAAESGINDAREAIQSGFLTKNPGGMGTCNDWGTWPVPSSDLDGNIISYTCLLIDPSPPSVTFAADTYQSSVINVQTATSSGPIQSIYINWTITTPPMTTDYADCSAAEMYVTSAAWPCSDAGALRLDITPWNTAGETSNDLEKNTMTTFLYPVNGVGATYINYYNNPGNEGNNIPVNCSSTNQCQLIIENTPPTNQLYLRLLGIFANNTVTISAFNNSTGTQPSQPIINSQATIDSTGKARDVVQRIEVGVPIQNLNGPSYAIQSTQSICKRFTTSGPDSGPPGDLTSIFSAPPAPTGTNYSSCFGFGS